MYKPIIYGVIYQGLQNNSFLSSTSFQKISCVFRNVTYHRFKDYLLRIDENCIVSIFFPIRTNKNFLNKKFYYPECYQIRYFKIKPFFLKKQQHLFKMYNLFWLKLK